jgi:hypothetical protein
MDTMTIVLIGAGILGFVGLVRTLGGGALVLSVTALLVLAAGLLSYAGDYPATVWPGVGACAAAAAVLVVTRKRARPEKPVVRQAVLTRMGGHWQPREITHADLPTAPAPAPAPAPVTPRPERPQRPLSPEPAPAPKPEPDRGKRTIPIEPYTDAERARNAEREAVRKSQDLRADSQRYTWSN